MIKHRIELNQFLPSKARVAEIGVAEGRWSLEMLQTWDIEKLYLVDVWQTMAMLKGDVSSPQSWHDKNFYNVIETLDPYHQKVSLLKGLSIQMTEYVPDNSLDLVYLDAGHDHGSVMADLKAWLPKLKIGGVMAGHDFLNPAYGVKSAVEDFTKEKYIVHMIPEMQTEDAGFFFIKR